MNKLSTCKSKLKCQNNVLLFFATSEGYVKNTAGVYSYVFNYTDQLGNVSVSYTLENSSLKILEENSYYPFGMKHATDSNNDQPNYKYKYNGKEYQDELGLNLTAMDFRQYDNTLGRFNVIDPLAEQDYGITPYHFGYDNPVLFGDPSGLKAQAPEGTENNVPSGGVLSMLMSGMSGKDISDYLSEQMWGSNMLSIHSVRGGGGGGSGSSVDTSSTDSLVQSLTDLLYSSDFHGVSWDSSTGIATGFNFETTAYPDLKSFKFQSFGIYQESAVKNVNFIIALVTIIGGVKITVDYVVEFPQAILFTLPTVLKDKTTIGSDMAAYQTAKIVNGTMEQTADKFAGTQSSPLQVEQYFRQQLKYNYKIGTPGGSVIFNAMNFRATPTYYKSY